MMNFTTSGSRALALVGDVDRDKSKVVLPPSVVPPTILAISDFDASKFAQSEYASLHVHVTPDTKLNWKVLAAATKLTKPGSLVHLSCECAPSDEKAKIEKALKKTFTYAGVQNIQIGGAEKLVYVSGQYPMWAGQGGTSIQSQGTSIDEDELLAGEKDVVTNKGKGLSDCSQQPRACANCSCGRKELEEKVGFEEAKRRLEEQKVESSCGNCGLGDAFRCDGCPYKGLPAFRPGEKVKLDMGNDGGGFDGMTEASVGADGKVILT
jgi:hypothetical protein